jgi:hypothetical protein
MKQVKHFASWYKPAEPQADDWSHLHQVRSIDSMESCARDRSARPSAQRRRLFTLLQEMNSGPFQAAGRLAARFRPRAE